MNQNEKLSLQEEVENEALRVEKEIADNPELKDIKVSDRMEAALLAKIQAYEKKNEQKHSTEDKMVKFPFRRRQRSSAPRKGDDEKERG